MIIRSDSLGFLVINNRNPGEEHRVSKGGDRGLTSGDMTSRSVHKERNSERSAGS
jgi:hypothetical protein